ncbi:hypothetical protein PoB_007517600 [Plakobranchus ocellatus]|uniref:Uncharacterized protein n=1 Tax=Plakobranchus ocellatus TaxID=259542 RepID=A0AAV4DXR3_9GAST|nr:hypothetical protein PoB_007517600 [Plakobranchus ocellatus]
MESKPVVEKDFEFLVCHRRGFVVLRLDSTVDQTFYFAESLGFKLTLTDPALGINTLTYDDNQHVNQANIFDGKRVQNTSSTGTRSAIQDHSFFGSKTPVISDNGCEFYVQQRQGQIALSQDNTCVKKFYFNAGLSFKLVFTDGKFSVIMPVQQIPQTQQTVKKPGIITESLSNISRNTLRDNQISQAQGITSTASVKMPVLSKLLTIAKSVEAFHNAPSGREQLKKTTNQSEISKASLSLTNSSCVHKVLKDATEGRILSHNSLISKQPNQSVEMQEKLSFNRVNRDFQYTDAHGITDVASSFSSENEENKFEIDAVQEFKPELNHESTDFQATHQTLILEVEDCKPSLADLKKELISEQLVPINEEETCSAQLACHKSRDSSRNANIPPKSLEETDSCQVQSSENEESIRSDKSFKKEWLQASRIKKENCPAGNKQLGPVMKVMRQSPRSLPQNKQTSLAALSKNNKGASYSLVREQGNQKMLEKQRKKNCRSLANDERRSQAPITNKQKIQAVTISKQTRKRIMNKKRTYYTQRRKKKRHCKLKKDEDYIPESDEEEDDNDISDFEEKKYVCGLLHWSSNKCPLTPAPGSLSIKAVNAGAAHVLKWSERRQPSLSLMRQFKIRKKRRSRSVFLFRSIYAQGFFIFILIFLSRHNLSSKMCSLVAVLCCNTGKVLPAEPRSDKSFVSNSLILWHVFLSDESASVRGLGKECAPPWLPRVVRGDHGRLSPMDCLSLRTSPMRRRSLAWRQLVASNRKAEDPPTLMSVSPFAAWSLFKTLMVISSLGSAKVADRSPFKIHRELKSILGDETMEVTKLGSGDLMGELKIE